MNSKKTLFLRKIKILLVVLKYNFEAKKQKKLFAKISKNFNDSQVSETYCGKAKQNFFITLKQSLKTHRNIFE